MTSRNLDIYNVQNALLTAFPELQDQIWTAFGDVYDLTKGTPEETPETYPVFEGVVAKLLFELLRSGKDDNLTRRLFIFFEDMANSPDPSVSRDLLGIAILEPLVFDKKILSKAWKYMGPKMKEQAVIEANNQDRIENLPPDYDKDVLPH